MDRGWIWDLEIHLKNTGIQSSELFGCRMRDGWQLSGTVIAGLAPVLKCARLRNSAVDRTGPGFGSDLKR